MAERRMFAKLIVNSDEFLDLPISSQVLYFHLVMQADDDGMINNARRIILMMGLDQKDLQLLIDNRFLISFDSGILAVRHWKQQNRIRSDRYKPTVYQEEFSQLVLLKDRTYALVIPDGNQMSYQWYPQYSIDKVSEDKVRGGKDREEKDKEEPASPVSVPDQVVESFDLFWNEYPRQHDRSETFSVFRDVLSSGTDPVAIMDGLERYLLYIRTEKIDTRYIMYPVTWLKKKCWLETYPVSKELTTKDLEAYVDFTNIIPKGSDDLHE